MLKLFVDDSRVPSSDWMVARTITEAIRAIARWHFDEISLDHDIEGYEQENFQPVAYFIAERYHTSKVEDYKGILLGHQPKITIHSGNPKGAESIKAILSDSNVKSEYKPYNTI